jgi:hypothetical protein
MHHAGFPNRVKHRPLTDKVRRSTRRPYLVCCYICNERGQNAPVARSRPTLLRLWTFKQFKSWEAACNSVAFRRGYYPFNYDGHVVLIRAASQAQNRIVLIPLYTRKNG